MNWRSEIAVESFILGKFRCYDVRKMQLRWKYVNVQGKNECQANKKRE
jgi:hypothetical protein